MNVVEWLVHRGAKKIFGSTDSGIGHIKYNRRLSFFKKYFGADIVLFRKKLQTKNSVLQFLNDASALGPTEALFLLPSEPATIKQEKKEVIETLVRGLETQSPEALLVNFIPSVVGIVQTMADFAYRTFNIELTKDGDIKEGLIALNQVIRTSSSHIIIRKKTESHSNITGKMILFVKVIVVDGKN